MSELASGGAQDPVTAPGAGPAWVVSSPTVRRSRPPGRLDARDRRAPRRSRAPAGAPARRHRGSIRRRGGRRHPERADRPGHRPDPTAVHGPERVPRRARPRRRGPLDRRAGDRELRLRGQLRLGVRRRSCRCRRHARLPDRARGQQRRHVLAARDRAHGETLGQAGAHRPAGHRLRRDRRPRLSRAAAGAPRRARSGDVPLARARARTGSSSGRPISRRRRARARRGSCSARTTTFPPSAGSRRTPAC